MCVTPLLHELYWLPVCIWVLVVTFKAHHGLWPAIYKNISPQSFLPVQSSRKDVLQVPLARECQLLGPRKRAFSVVALILWDIIPWWLYCSSPWWSFIKLYKHYSQTGSPSYGCMNDTVDLAWLLCVFIFPFYYVFCVVSCFIISLLESHKSEMGSYINQANKK